MTNQAPPPPVSRPPGRDGEPGFLTQLWRSFRSAPLWAQVLAWIFLVVVLITAIGSTADPDSELTLVDESTTTEAPPETRSEESSTTTEPTTSTAETTTTTAETTTTTTEAPTTTSAPERVELSSTGEHSTAPFDLKGGSYLVEFSFDSDCYYGAHLKRADGTGYGESLATGNGPVKGTSNVYGVSEGSYYVKLFTGPQPNCPWTIVLTAQ